MIQLGRKIKSLRCARGLTQIQLAEMAGVDNTLICKIEAEQTRGSLSSLQKLATALGVKVSDLFEEQAS